MAYFGQFWKISIYSKEIWVLFRKLKFSQWRSDGFHFDWAHVIILGGHCKPSNIMVPLLWPIHEELENTWHWVIGWRISLGCCTWPILNFEYITAGLFVGKLSTVFSYMNLFNEDLHPYQFWPINGHKHINIYSPRDFFVFENFDHYSSYSQSYNVQH